MILKIKSASLYLLGDPHMGRPFRNGVPLHRLGDREKMQLETLSLSLSLQNRMAVGYDAHICMGDLFDKEKVANEVVAKVADLYLATAKNDPCCPLFVITGNHDELRDADYVSSFQLFTRIVDDHVRVIRQKPRRFSIKDADIVLIPWHPVKTAREMVEEHVDLIMGADAVFGHWDVDGRLEGTDNYVPADLFADLNVGMIVTGHDHVRRDMTIAGLPVVVVGSMQPYSHAEDKDGDIYVTETADEVRENLLMAKDWYRFNCLRVIGEWDDEIPDCLQFKVVANEVELQADEALAQVQLASFSMKELWDQAFEGVDSEVTDTLKVKFAEMDGEMD